MVHVDWRKMRPEERVKVTLEMVDLVTSIAAGSEKAKNPRITEDALISRMRRRCQQGRRFPSRR